MELVGAHPREKDALHHNDEVDTIGNLASGSRSTPDSCRETLRINDEEQAFHHHLTLGLQEKLQRNRMIRNIKSQFRKPVDKQTLSLWERKNGVILPGDLKDYFQSTNGFKLTWSLEHAGDVLPIGELSINSLSQLVEIHIAAKQAVSGTPAARGSTASLMLSPASSSGRPKTSSTAAENTSSRHLLSLSASSGASRKPEGQQQHGSSPNDFGTNLISLPFNELEQTLVGSNNGQTKLAISSLSYSPENKIFILDSGRSNWGKVCLVYPSPPSSDTGMNSSSSPASSKSPRLAGETSSRSKTIIGSSSAHSAEPYVEIWFMDPSYHFHFLAPTFTHYYRMLLLHLGLPQWHYRFTPFGLSSWAEQMFWLVAPHLLQTPKISRFPSMYHGEGLWCTDVPSEAATPNSTLNVLSNQLFRRKKKDAK